MVHLYPLEEAKKKKQKQRKRKREREREREKDLGVKKIEISDNNNREGLLTKSPMRRKYGT